MQVVLVHHAEAVSPAVDFERPLSSRGLRQAAQIAEALRAAGFTPEAIWHSGKRRAKQTAEAFLRACSPSAQFLMVRGLRPDDPVAWMRDELTAETRNVLVAGHMPHIAHLLHELAPDSAAMPLHGVVVLERRNGAAWREIWRREPEE